MTSPKSENRPDQVYDFLRALIVKGQLAPGARVVEAEIADRLGVSRTPVREALTRLEQEGYVTSASGKRARPTVAPLTRNDVRELLNIVGGLEGLAVRLVCELPAVRRKMLVKELNALNSEFATAAQAQQPDFNRLFEADEQFHRHYVEAGAGARLRALYEAVKPQAERYIRMYVSLLVGDVQLSTTEHNAIVKAIGDGDADAAETAVEANWRHAAERLARVIEEAGERGIW